MRGFFIGEWMNAAVTGWRGAADAQPFGFPGVPGQTGEAVNSLRSHIRPLVSCLPCVARLRVSRSWQPVCFSLSFIVIANLAQQVVEISRPRLPQSLALLRNDNLCVSGVGVKLTPTPIPSRSFLTLSIQLQEPTEWAIVRQVGSAPTDEVGYSGNISLLARRASQFLTGDKPGVSERSELTSACQGREAQSGRRPL